MTLPLDDQDELAAMPRRHPKIRLSATGGAGAMPVNLGKQPPKPPTRLWAHFENGPIEQPGERMQLIFDPDPSARAAVRALSKRAGTDPVQLFQELAEKIQQWAPDFLAAEAPSRLLGYPEGAGREMWGWITSGVQPHIPQLPAGKRVARQLEHILPTYGPAMRECLEQLQRAREGGGELPEEAWDASFSMQHARAWARDAWFTEIPIEAALHAGASLGTLAQALALWSLSRVCYVIDPELEEALAASQPGELPIRLLQHLPQECTYITLSGQQMPLGPSGEDGQLEPMAILGAFVRLLIDSSGRAEGLMITLDSGRIDRSFSWPVLFGQGEASTVGSMLDRLEGYFEAERRKMSAPAELLGRSRMILPREANEQTEQQIMRALSSRIISVLLYLTSSRADVGPAPAARSAAEAARSLIPRKQREHHEVPAGYRVGAVIRKAAREAQGTGAPTGRSVRPHMRSGHWKTVWHGPRKDPEPVATWIMPTAVLGGGEDIVDRPVEAGARGRPAGGLT